MAASASASVEGAVMGKGVLGRFFSSLVSIVLVVGLCPGLAFAADEYVAAEMAGQDSASLSSQAALPKQAELEKFLARLFWYSSGDASQKYEYDCTDPTQYSVNIIANMIMHPGVSVALTDGTYPVTIFEQRGVSRAIAAKWPAGYAGPAGTVVADDPLGKFDEYYICDGNAVEWVTRNIFNVGATDYATLRDSGDSASYAKYYYQGGKYYSQTGGLGYGGIDLDLISWEQKGSRYNVHFGIWYLMGAGSNYRSTPYSCELYAQVGLKEIDGNQYWSLYKLSEEPLSEMRFKPSRDGNAFAHSNGRGGGFEGLSFHRLDRKYLDSLLASSDVNSHDRWSVTDAMLTTWHGSCHGIAATMMMLYEGELRVSDLRVRGTLAKTYAELGRPCENSNLYNAIEYYHLSQYVDCYDSAVISEVYPSWWKSKAEGGDELSTLLRLMYSKAANGTVACLSFGCEKYGHTILVTDVKPATGGYAFLIYDSNDAGAGFPGALRQMYVSSDFNSFSFTDANGSTVTQNNYRYLTLRGAQEFSKAGSGVAGLAEQTVQGKTLLRFRSGYPVTVTDASGRALTFDSEGRLSGSIEVSDISFAETDGVYELLAWTDAVSPIEVAGVSGSDTIRLAVGDENGYTSVDASGAGKASVSATGDAAIESKGQCDFRVFASLNESDEYASLEMASCEGTAVGDVSAERGDGVLVVSSAGGMSDVKTTGIRGATSADEEVGDVAAGASVKVAAPASVKMHRLYNPNSYEHFYTGDEAEFEHLVSLGWQDEKYGWTAPAYGDPVYRLYNPNNGGDHHYTLDPDERDMLIAAGWQDEEIGWYSDSNKTVTVYREYNPNEVARNHNYTADKAEHDYLVSLGWRDELIAWYGV